MREAAMGLAVAAAFLAIMAGMSWWASRALPPSGPVAIHFNWRGQADGFGSRWLVLSVVPVAYLIVCAFAGVIARNAGNGGSWVEAAVIPGAISLVGHAFVLWLVVRWAGTL